MPPPSPSYEHGEKVYVPASQKAQKQIQSTSQETDWRLRSMPETSNWTWFLNAIIIDQNFPKNYYQAAFIHHLHFSNKCPRPPPINRVSLVNKRNWPWLLEREATFTAAFSAAVIIKNPSSVYLLAYGEMKWSEAPKSKISFRTQVQFSFVKLGDRCHGDEALMIQ